jgi:hypothetical protein
VRATLYDKFNCRTTLDAHHAARLTSGYGTNRTIWAGLVMSVVWARPEVAFRDREDRFWRKAAVRRNVRC